MYWYISTAKVTMLSQQYHRGALDKLAVRLKSPVVEAEVRLTMPDPTLLKKLHGVERKIGKEFQPPPFDALAADQTPPPYFSFRVPGARLVNKQEFWLAGHVSGVALLMVGATHHSFGGPDRPTDMSPSLDPLGTILGYATGQPSLRPASTVDVAASYAWGAVMRHNGQNLVRLPEVSGLAVTIGVMPAVEHQVRRAGVADVATIVIGTPLFIVQD